MTRVKLLSLITCPKCGVRTKQKMPKYAVQYMYECGHCHHIARTSEEECCIFCKHGNVPCPRTQMNLRLGASRVEKNVG